MKNSFSRRDFLRTSTLTGSALLLLPRARLALAYEANGMVSDALSTFRLVLELDRSNSDAQERIEKLQSTQK